MDSLATLSRVIALIVLIPVIASAQTAAAESSTVDAPAPMVTAGVTMDVVSSYVWRGFVVSDEVSVQPTLWVNVGPVTVSSFVNTSRASAGGHVMNEHDLTVEYARDAGRVTMAAGWVNYFFRDPVEGRHSNEVYVRSSLATALAPTLLVAYDMQEGSGTYVSAGVAREWPLARRRLSAEMTAAIGYNHRQWTDDAGWSDLNVGVRCFWRAARWPVSFAPFVNYSHSLNAAPNRLYGGVALAVL